MSVLRFTQYTPLAECPNCRKLMDLRRTSCPECREAISQEYAQKSARLIIFNSHACNIAKDFRDREGFYLVLIPAMSAVYYLMHIHWMQVLVGFVVLVQVISVVGWLRFFGRFTPLGDARFIAATKTMKESRRLWLGIFMAQCVVIYASLR